MPEFTCVFEQQGSPLPHAWEHTVGSGHAHLALRADWQAQLRRCHSELGIQHTRFHGILSDDMCTLTKQRGELVYSFFNADQIMDFLVSLGMHPFVELSFMPSTLSTGSDTVFFYKGNVTPPQDYGQWATLIRKLVRHWVNRYGIAEVRQWYFEVWNEPNLDAFWEGSQADYFKLYRYTVNAIKEIDSALRVGGPATANNSWIGEFVDSVKPKSCPPILSAPITIPPMPLANPKTILKPSWPPLNGVFCANGQWIPVAMRAVVHSTTRSGTPPPIPSSIATTNPMPQPLP